MTLQDCVEFYNKLTATFGRRSEEETRALKAQAPSRTAITAALKEADDNEAAVRADIERLKAARLSAQANIEKWTARVAEVEAKRDHHIVIRDQIDRQMGERIKAIRDVGGDKRQVYALMEKLGIAMPEEVRAESNEFIKAVTYGLGYRS